MFDGKEFAERVEKRLMEIPAQSLFRGKALALMKITADHYSENLDQLPEVSELMEEMNEVCIGKRKAAVIMALAYLVTTYVAEAEVYHEMNGPKLMRRRQFDDLSAL